MINIVILNCPPEKDNPEKDYRNKGLKEMENLLDALQIEGLRHYSRKKAPLNNEVKYLNEKIKAAQLILILVSVDFLAAFTSGDPSDSQKVIKALKITLEELKNKEKIIPISYSTNDFTGCKLFEECHMRLPSRSTIIDDKNFSPNEQWQEVRVGIRRHIEQLNVTILTQKINELFPENTGIPNGLIHKDKEYKLVNEIDELDIDDYIRPVFFDSLYASMDDSSHVVIVVGPSGCGKSFVVKQVIKKIMIKSDSREFDWIDCQPNNQDSKDKIIDKLSNIDAGNKVVINNYHVLDQETRDFVISKAKEIMESESQTLLVIIGNTSINNNLMSSLNDPHFEDLHDTYQIDFSTHGSAAIKNMLYKVSNNLETKFSERFKDAIIELSVDNIYIAISLLIIFLHDFVCKKESHIPALLLDENGVLDYREEQDLYKIVDNNIGLGNQENFFKGFQNRIHINPDISAKILKNISVHPKRGIISFRRLRYDSQSKIQSSEINKILIELTSLKNTKITEGLSKDFNKILDYHENQQKLVIRDIKTLFYLNYFNLTKMNK